VISQNGIDLAGPRLNLFRTAGTCVSFSGMDNTKHPTAHSAARLRVNCGTVEMYRIEEQHAMPSFNMLPAGHHAGRVVNATPEYRRAP
jgi:hypothetical protein